MPSTARGSPCGVDPGDETGQGWTSPASPRYPSTPTRCSAMLWASQGGHPERSRGLQVPEGRHGRRRYRSPRSRQ
eukprot:8910208-Alexandrium_andersonii.AAC.1